MTSPYKLSPPFAVSFSGGRTSAFMLRHIIDAHGGQLPDESHVVFANTGREHPATLDFVQECAEKWGIRVDWVEYDTRQDRGYRVVDRSTASVNGEPFKMLLEKKMFLPNAIMRFCTMELKVNIIAKYLHDIGMSHGTMAVGLRADEQRRVARVQNDERNGYDYDCPIAKAGHCLKDVADYWKQADFDLRLPHGTRAHGNCDLCFLKGRSVMETVIRDRPQSADWWIEMEEMVGGTFRNGITYQQTLIQVNTQPLLFNDMDDEGHSISCTCTD
jgi:hypothetical protein